MHLVCLTYFLLMVMYVFISIYVWCLCSILRKFPEKSNNIKSNKNNQNRNLFCQSQFIGIWVTFEPSRKSPIQAIAHYRIYHRVENNKFVCTTFLLFVSFLFVMPWNGLVNQNLKMKNTPFLLKVRTETYRRRWRKLMAKCIDKSVNKSGP